MVELLTVNEVATLLKVDPETVYRWIRASKLKAVKAGDLWRVPTDYLDEFLKSEDK